MTQPTVGFVGMTHLGLVSAIGTASKGVRVVGFDRDPELCVSLKAGELPVVEPDLDTMLAEHRGMIDFTADFDRLGTCDIVYVAPDVPTDDKGQSDLAPIISLIDRVVPKLSCTTLLVILCQVPPGFTRSLPVEPDRLFYQVETLIFGRAVERATQPERFIIGCADPARAMPRMFVDVLSRFGCPILPMRYESAELAKISINMYLVASVGVANTMAEICEGSGAIWHEIVPALKLDRRIGPYSYLAPGLGIAGGNLERDLATVIRMSEQQGADAGIVKAWIENSRHRRDWAARTIRATLLDGQTDAVVAIWGLAYKENTHSVKNSPSLATIDQLPDTKLRLHDPVVPAAAVRHDRASGFGTALEAALGADALMILTPWPEYREIDPHAIARALRGRLVLDPYRVLNADKAANAGLRHLVLGASVPADDFRKEGTTRC